MKREVFIEFEDGEKITQKAASGDVLLNLAEYNARLITKIYYLEGDKRVDVLFEDQPISKKRPVLKAATFAVNFSVPKSRRTKMEKTDRKETLLNASALLFESRELFNRTLKRISDLEQEHQTMKLLYGEAVLMLTKFDIKEIPLPYPSEHCKDPEGTDALRECLVNLITRWKEFDSNKKAKLQELLVG